MGAKKQTVGHRYFVGVVQVLCHGPVDSVRRIFFGEKEAWSGNVTANQQININKRDLFGGESSEGGVGAALQGVIDGYHIEYDSDGNLEYIPIYADPPQFTSAGGQVDICFGLPTQGRNDYALDKIGDTVSAFRGVMSVVFRQFYFGTTYYLKDIWYEVSRTKTGYDGAPIWYAAKSEIIFDSAPNKPAMNPAHAIREILLATEWGMGVPVTDIDDAAFRTAADTLHAEGFGVSMTWQVAGEVQEKLSELLETVAGVLYVSPETGLYTLKLMRADYDVATLPTLGEAQIIEVSDYTRAKFDDLSNCVALTHWDQVLEDDNTIQTDDPAMVAKLGKVVTLEKEYSGIVDEALAARIALRDLKAASAPILSAKITCTRAAADLRPGDAFKFAWPQYHEGFVVCRVVDVGLGDTSGETITITLVEDIFALPDNAATSGEGIAWQDPATAPIGTATALLIEAPYAELVQRLGDTAAQALLAANPTAGRMLIACSSASNAQSADGIIDGVTIADTLDPTPTGTLTNAISRTAQVLQINWARVPVAGQHMQIGNEIMIFRQLAGADTIVGRGALDTVPTAHAAGAMAWCWDQTAQSDGIDRVSGETVTGQVLPKQPAKVGTLSAQVSTVTAARAVRPYPPARVAIRGEFDPSQVFGDAVITWNHRNRITQADALLSTLDGSVTPEAGTTYAGKIYNADTGAVLCDESGITGQTCTSAANYTGPARLEFWSVRDGYASAQKHVFTFEWLNSARLTESGAVRITESGEIRIIEG